MIVLGGFKELNCTLTKTEIQINQVQGITRRLPVQAWKPIVKHEIQSTLRSVPANYRVSKTLEGVLWTVKKLKTKLSNTWLRSVKKREAYSSQCSIQNARFTQASVQFQTRGLLKPMFNSKCEAYSSQRSIQNARLSPSQCSIWNVRLSPRQRSIRKARLSPSQRSIRKARLSPSQHSIQMRGSI